MRKQFWLPVARLLPHSTVVAKSIEEILRDRGSMFTPPMQASEVASMTSGVDLVVTTTPLQGNLGVPVIQTLAFLTGIGKEAVIEQIIQRSFDQGE
jgi:PTS system galactitol-specific IIB component